MHMQEPAPVSTPRDLEAACRLCSSRGIIPTKRILPDAPAMIPRGIVDTSSFKNDLARCHYRGRRDRVSSDLYDR